MTKEELLYELVNYTNWDLTHKSREELQAIYDELFKKGE